MKFSIKDFFSECDQIRRSLRIWSHLMKKFLMESFIFCAEFAENCSRISQILRKVVFDRITDQKIVKRLISCTGRFWNKVLTLVVLNILSQQSQCQRFFSVFLKWSLNILHPLKLWMPRKQPSKCSLKAQLISGSTQWQRAHLQKSIRQDCRQSKTWIKIVILFHRVCAVKKCRIGKAFRDLRARHWIF